MRARTTRPGPFSGECIGVYAGRDPAEIDAALDACLAYLETEAWFYAATTAEDPDRPVAFFPARDRVGRALPGAAGRHPRRQPARLPDRAAAGIDRGPRRGLQGRARPASRSGSARRRRRTSAAATWRAICPRARPRRARSRPRSSTSARHRSRAVRPAAPARRPRGRSYARAARARPAVTAARPAASRRSRPASASPRSPIT